MTEEEKKEEAEYQQRVFDKLSQPLIGWQLYDVIGALAYHFESTRGQYDGLAVALRSAQRGITSGA